MKRRYAILKNRERHENCLVSIIENHIRSDSFFCHVYAVSVQ
jgi:hypothetical protein